MTRARSLSKLANSSALIVDTNLNVGIGSTTPDVKLDVIGNMEVSGVLTATTFDGNLTGNVTGNLNSTGVSTVTTLKVGTGITAEAGIITATSFVGDGSGLTGLNVPVGFNELDAALFN